MWQCFWNREDRDEVPAVTREPDRDDRFPSPRPCRYSAGLFGLGSSMCQRSTRLSPLLYSTGSPFDSWNEAWGWVRVKSDDARGHAVEIGPRVHGVSSGAGPATGSIGHDRRAPRLGIKMILIRHAGLLRK